MAKQKDDMNKPPEDTISQKDPNFEDLNRTDDVIPAGRPDPDEQRDTHDEAKGI